MANLGGFNFTGFRGVNLKNTAAIRFEGDGGFVGTLSVRPAQDASRQWILPDKSGGFGVTGTFLVSYPEGNAINGIISTVVTVAGIRAEDGLVCSMQGSLATAGVALVGFVPGNGNITVYLHNGSGIGLNTLNVLERVVAYTAVR